MLLTVRTQFLAPFILAFSGSAAALAVQPPAKLTPAQPVAPAPAPAPPQPAAPRAPDPPVSASLKRQLADALVRVALFDLRVLKTPGATDYTLAGQIGDLAQSFVPDDLELLHRRVEAAWGAGDKQKLIELTEQIVKLDPKDSVAQLRLISSRMAAFQTTEDRLARYAVLLGPKGESIDSSVRSRLAMDAALLRRERGDDAGFLEFLKQAVALDGTNKEAALLAFNYYRQRANQPMGRLELLSNLLFADPIDPNAHFMLADELASQGAFTQARRFHRVGQQILKVSGVPDDFRLFSRAMVLDWLVEGPAKPLAKVNGYLEAERSRVARQRREILGEDSKGAASRLSEIPSPDQVRLQSAEQEAIRIATAWILGDDTQLAASMRDLTATLEGQIEILKTPNTRPAGMSETDAADEIRARYRDLCLWRFITGKDGELAAAGVDKAVEGLPPENADRRAVLAWAAIFANKPADAIALCDAPGPSSDWIKLARATALAKSGDNAAAAKAFEAAGREAPLTILGAVAFEKSAQCSGAKRPAGDLPSEDSRAAAAYTSKIPAWIDTITDRPQLVQTVTVDPGPARMGPLDRAVFTITIRNVCPIPLAVGSDKPVNTRCLLSPKLELGATERLGFGEPEVLDLSRRLRLLPGESLEATVWPEAGLLGWLAQNAASGPCRVRWQFIQGFETRSGRKAPGAGCIEIMTPTQSRDALLDARLPTEALVERINTADDSNLQSLLVAARSVLTQPIPEGQLADPGRAAVADALAAKYPGWTKAGRLLAVATMPPATQVPELKGLDDAIRVDLDRSVLLVALITRAATPDDPCLRAARESADPVLTRAAELQAERIGKDLPLYSRFGVSKIIAERTPSAGNAP